MDRFIVKKTSELRGDIHVSTSKNAVLPILAASMLTDDEVIIHRVPELRDVASMLSLMRCFGFSCDRQGDSVVIRGGGKESVPPQSLMQSLRASILALGALIVPRGSVKLPFPGGCDIGVRPIDLHLKGLRALGAKALVLEGYVDVRARKLRGANIYLDYPSVGATENILLAAARAQGETVIQNAATEPEIEDLANFLNAMGAKISGAGSATIYVEGVKKLCGCEYTPIPDRIEAGTFMAAAAAVGGEVRILNCCEQHITPVISKLEECGALIKPDKNAIIISAPKKVKVFNITSSPHPGFPTDLQAQFAALACAAQGACIITENVFENRFSHMAELIKMGAEIKIEGRTSVIIGGKKLSGANVCAGDLRAGAALVIAGMIADGTTEISNIHLIDRGYEHLENKLSAVGANIVRSAK